MQPRDPYNVGEDGVAQWSYLDISTAHIEPGLLADLSAENTWLDTHGYAVAPELSYWPPIIPYPAGFFLLVCREADADPATEAAYPACLREIMAFARSRQAALVRVDADGTMTTGLRLYDTDK